MEAIYLKDDIFCEGGGLGRIRTPDPLIRSQVLYPTELPVREGVSYAAASGFATPKRASFAGIYAASDFGRQMTKVVPSLPVCSNSSLPP